MKVKVIKSEPQVLRFKNVKVTYATLNKPQEVEKKDSTKVKQYSVTIALEKGSPEYKQYLEAVKQVASGLSKAEIQDMLIGSMGKLSRVKDTDLERIEDLSEDAYKTTFKTGEDFPPTLYDWTEGKTKESGNPRISGGDVIMMEGRMFLGKHKTGFYLGTQVTRVALLESNSNYNDPKGWFDFAGVEEDAGFFSEEEPKKEKESKKDEDIEIKEVSFDDL